jgi:hypothetical protein
VTAAGPISAAGPPAPVAAPGAPTAASLPAPAFAAPPPPRRRLSSLLAGTPSRLSALSTVTVLALLAFGIVGALAIGARASALADARSDAEQLVRLQLIRTNLVQADAAAANAYLAGGLENPAQRDQYRASIDAAAQGLVAAANAAPAEDIGPLAQINASLARYTGIIESARANNRQHFPVGAAYLRQGSTLLRTDVRPVLIATSDATANRVLDDYDASARATLALEVVSILALVVLLGGQVWLARTVRRVFNVGLVGATGIALVVGSIGLVAMSWAQGRAEEVRQHPYAAVAALAQARVNAFDAKSQESRNLIFQGSGAGDTDWKALDAEVTRQLDAATAAGASSLADRLAAWRAVHEEIRRLDDGGEWKAAVVRSTGDEAGSSNQEFAAFARASQDELDAEVAETRDGLDRAHLPLVTVQLLVVLAGAIAAACAGYGYARRLAEYR